MRALIDSLTAATMAVFTMLFVLFMIALIVWTFLGVFVVVAAGYGGWSMLAGLLGWLFSVVFLWTLLSLIVKPDWRKYR